MKAIKSEYLISAKYSIKLNFVLNKLEIDKDKVV